MADLLHANVDVDEAACAANACAAVHYERPAVLCEVTCGRDKRKHAVNSIGDALQHVGGHGNNNTKHNSKWDTEEGQHPDTVR